MYLLDFIMMLSIVCLFGFLIKIKKLLKTVKDKSRDLEIAILETKSILSDLEECIEKKSNALINIDKALDKKIDVAKSILNNVNTEAFNHQDQNIQNNHNLINNKVILQKISGVR